MSQQEENTFTDDDLIKGRAEKSDEVSAVSQEAVKSMTGNFRSLARGALVVALNVLDGDNPPEIEDADKDKNANSQDITDKTDEKSGDKAVSANAVDAKHNEEIRSILLNADSILARHHRAPIGENTGKGANTTNGANKEGKGVVTDQSTAKQPGRSIVDTGVNTGNSSQAKPVQKTQAAQKVEQEKQAREKEIKEREAKRIALQEKYKSTLTTDLNKKIDLADLPKEITDSEDAEQFLEYARQNNKKVIMAFSMNGCGVCTKMDKEVYPLVDDLVMHVNVNNLDENISQFATKFGIDGNDGKGSINAFPHIALFGLSNDYKLAQEEQTGFIDIEKLRRLIKKVN